MSKTNKRLVSILLVLSMVLAVLPMAVFAADTTRLYCAAPSNWTNCNVYWWGSVLQYDPSWPGEAMTLGADGIWYYDVPSDASNVIFNNGSAQSADLVMPTDDNVQFNYEAKTWSTYGSKVEAPELETVTLYVEVPTSWGTPNAYWWGSAGDDPGWPGYAMTAYEGNVYSYEIPNDVTGLIFNGNGSQTADLALPTGEDIMYSVAAQSWGPLQINGPVEVTYTYVVAGSEKLCGTAWDYTNIANTMTVSGNMASITYTSVPTGDHEFKVVKVGSDGSVQWIGNDGDNVTFTILGLATVTIELDLTTEVIYHESMSEGPPADPWGSEYYVTGDMNYWLKDNMCDNWNETYSVTIPVRSGTYKYRVVNEDESWSCPAQDEIYVLVVSATCDVTFLMDIQGYRVTATGDGVESNVIEPLDTVYYLRGDFNDWGLDTPMTRNEDGTHSATVFLEAGTYEYKAAVDDWSWSVPGGDDAVLTLTEAADVTFVLDVGAGTLTNDAPVAYDYHVAGSEGLCGAEWDPAKNQMTYNEATGLYEITFAVYDAGTYEYKITTGSWETPSYGYGEGNYTVVVKNAADVTITFNAETTEVGCTVKEYGVNELKFQLNADATAASATVDLRMITYVTSLDYDSVEFVITINGNTTTVGCEVVYEAINANGATLSCTDIFGVEGYLVTYTLAGIPSWYFDFDINVNAVYTDLNGDVVGGNGRSLVLADILA